MRREEGRGRKREPDLSWLSWLSTTKLKGKRRTRRREEGRGRKRQPDSSWLILAINNKIKREEEDEEE